MRVTRKRNEPDGKFDNAKFPSASEVVLARMRVRPSMNSIRAEAIGAPLDWSSTRPRNAPPIVFCAVSGADHVRHKTMARKLRNAFACCISSIHADEIATGEDGAAAIDIGENFRRVVRVLSY